MEQWEEDEEPLPVDELPEWDPRKPRPNIDLSDMSKFGEPEDFLKASKKGQSVMMFVRVSGQPTRHEAEEISSIWQTGLWNNHVHVDRFMVEDDRAIFLFKVILFSFKVMLGATLAWVRWVPWNPSIFREGFSNPSIFWAIQ